MCSNITQYSPWINAEFKLYASSGCYPSRSCRLHVLFCKMWSIRRAFRGHSHLWDSTLNLDHLQVWIAKCSRQSRFIFEPQNRLPNFWAGSSPLVLPLIQDDRRPLKFCLRPHYKIKLRTFLSFLCIHTAIKAFNRERTFKISYYIFKAKFQALSHIHLRELCHQLWI